jgi:hypothetical protein
VNVRHYEWVTRDNSSFAGASRTSSRAGWGYSPRNPMNMTFSSQHGGEYCRVAGKHSPTSENRDDSVQLGFSDYTNTGNGMSVSGGVPEIHLLIM